MALAPVSLRLCWKASCLQVFKAFSWILLGAWFSWPWSCSGVLPGPAASYGILWRPVGTSFQVQQFFLHPCPLGYGHPQANAYSQAPSISPNFGLFRGEFSCQAQLEQGPVCRGVYSLGLCCSLAWLNSLAEKPCGSWVTFCFLSGLLEELNPSLSGT